jgi:hypothetical protein
MDRLRFANEDVLAEVADIYSGLVVGSWVVALMGVRTHL